MSTIVGLVEFKIKKDREDKKIGKSSGNYLFFLKISFVIFKNILFIFLKKNPACSRNHALFPILKNFDEN